MRHVILFFSIALTGAALDLLTKHLAFTYLLPREEVQIIDGFFSFGRTFNMGVIFGLFQDSPTFWKVISIVAVPVILAIFFSVKKPKWIVTIALGMVLAGTIGNMYDRILFGAVRDFIKFYNLPWMNTWPLFNLADSFIVVGVILLSVEMVFFDEGGKKKPAVAVLPALPALPEGAALAPPADPSVPPLANDATAPDSSSPADPVSGAGPVVEGK